MMKKTTNWMPLVRHNRSQNTLVVYTLVDGLDALVVVVLSWDTVVVFIVEFSLA